MKSNLNLCMLCLALLSSVTQVVTAGSGSEKAGALAQQQDKSLVAGLSGKLDDLARMIADDLYGDITAHFRSLGVALDYNDKSINANFDAINKKLDKILEKLESRSEK